MPTTPLNALVGREAELRALAALSGVRADPARPAGRSAQAVLLAGDAGVGKTRLLTELRDVAFAEGWQVVAGHSLDFGDSALPYLPFSEVVGRLVTERPDLVDAVAEAHPALGRLRPGRRLLGEESADSLDRGALYEAVHALLTAAAELQPLLLVVEDAHWADSSSRDLMTFLFTRAFAASVAVVVSYRSDDLHRRHPLRRQAAEWARIPGVERLQLEPLPSEAVRTLVRDLHAGPLSEADLAGIVERADGNAFFVEELVGAAGLEHAGELPWGLADLLLLRLEQLRAEGQEVVRDAAVAGRRVGYGLLSAVSGLGAAELDAGLRDAVGHHLLVPNRDDTYAFRHALLAEAVYDDLLPGERTRLHAAYTRAMLADPSLGTAAELARHARAARQPAAALDASIRAGEEAMSVGGPIEAARHFETALELLADPSLPADHEVDVATLGARTVDALVAAGNPPRGLALAVRLLEQLGEDADPVQRAILRAAVADTITVAETRLDPLAYTTPALAEMDPAPSALRARLLHLHARALGFHHRREEAREVGVEALSMAEALGMPRLGSDIAASLAAVNRYDGAADVEDVEQALHAAAESAARTGARQAQLRAVWLLGRWYYDRAELDRSRDYFTQAWQLAQEIGSSWAPYGFDSRFSLLLIAHLVGDWDEVGVLADVSGQSPPVMPEATLRAGLLTVQAGRGEVDQLGVAPRLRQQWEADGVVAITAAPATIELHGVAGDRSAALAVHDDAVETLSRLWRGRFNGQVRLAAVTLGALARGLDTEAADVRRRVVADADRVRESADLALRAQRESTDDWGPEGIAWARRLHAEHLRLCRLAGVDAPAEDELVAAWRADLAGFEALGHVVEIARSRTRLAAALPTGAEEVRTLLAAARACAERLGAKPLLAELDALGGPGPRARGNDDLTPREQEILTLVAAGRSNGEIGKQLFISTKTVSVHVSHILAKLGAGGRTEAAAIARREGLLG
ncbi:helix-turn-helix transcriptional regulator [Nocardioides mangrovicus]|uniref:helix-turn-helix transcriptional regulator n=1 Tax=Nocardioides mangrovicus TaxID=2478913 RepID=UPI001314EA9A|nr:helix-turn-helix transcriptional regulator [Nocardioides mangrovicus]